MTDPRLFHFDANGLRFAALEAGAGPLVLCLHGFPDNAWTFRAQISALVDAGYRIVAPFLRGYAPSAIPEDGRFQSAVLAQDVVAMLDALGEPAAAVFGHDWGAVAAAGAAILAPAKMARLVTAAVPHGPSVPQALMTSYAQQKRSWYMFFFQSPLAEMAVAHEDYRFLEELWRDWSPGWDFPREAIEEVKATFREPGVLTAALSYYRCTLDPTRQDPELAGWQQSLAFSPISVPSLVFHGERDGCIGGELLEGMESFFPAGVEVHRLPDAGHFLHREQPEAVNRILLNFLQRPV